MEDHVNIKKTGLRVSQKSKKLSEIGEGTDWGRTSSWGARAGPDLCVASDGAAVVGNPGWEMAPRRGSVSAECPWLCLCLMKSES